MADHITVRGEQAAPAAAGTEGSAKKSNLDQQVEHLAQRIKHRTGRADISDDVLRGMLLRRQANVTQREQAAETQKSYVKTTSQETLQSRPQDPHSTLVGRTREANTGDGLTNHQRQLVTSDPHAPAILPGATTPQITSQGAQSFLERALGLLSSEGAPVTVQNYAETLVARTPTVPGEKSLLHGVRDGAQRGATASETGQPRGGEGTARTGQQGATVGRDGQPLLTGRDGQPTVTVRSGETVTTRAEEHPQRPLPDPTEPGTGTGTGTTGGTPTDRPTTGRPTTPQPPVTPQPPGTPEPHPETPAFGRPTSGSTDIDPNTGKPRPPSSGTIHLTPTRGGTTPQPPTHSGVTKLGKTTVSGAQATDASTSTPLAAATHSPGQPVKAPAGQRPSATGANLGGPVAGRTTRGAKALPGEKSNPGTTMSLRGSGRRTRATDITTGNDGTIFINTGGGIDTTTSWDGMHFNWEAFFVRFMFKFQENENEARRLMKELREAMHKLAQEGIRAKIALEKMNQAFERADKAFELGSAMKSMMQAVQEAAKQGQQQGGQQGEGGQQGQGQQGQGQQGQGQQGPGGQQGGQGQAPAQTRQGQVGSAPSGNNPTQNNSATSVGSQPGQMATGGPPQQGGQEAGGPQGQGQGQGGDQQGQGKDKGKGEGEGHGLPGGGLVGDVSEHLRRDAEKLNAEVVSQAQRGASEMDGKIRSAYMQAQGLFGQMCQLLAMSRSKGA